MNLLDNYTLLPKKRDYQAVLSGFKVIYGADRRNYKNLKFDPNAVNQYLTKQFTQRYGDMAATEQHFHKFWQAFEQWFKNTEVNTITVEIARDTINLFMQYDFQQPSNVEYF